MRDSLWVIVSVAVLVAFLVLLAINWPSGPSVALYCSQDEPFARELLQTFSDQTKLLPGVKFDTEANKSVGLVQELLHDRQRPRADVFWNNEVLGMIRLEQAGVLAETPSPFGADDKPSPPSAVSKTGQWVAFASRARVLLVNTELLKPEDYPKSLLDLTQARYRGKVAMAKPLAGMSATQAVCLFEVLGAEPARQYYRELKANGVQVSPGNKQAAEWAGKGRSPSGGDVAVCVTDTDDALAEIRAGRPVKMIFPDGEGEARAPRMGTLFVPNTLAIIAGGPNPMPARRLVDYLLSSDVEAALASGDAGQIPVRKSLRKHLPPAMQPATEQRPMDVDFYRAAELWETAQAFLREEFAR